MEKNNSPKISFYKKCYCASCGEKMDATRPNCPKCNTPNVLFDRRYLNDLHIGTSGNLTFFLVGFLSLNLLGAIFAILIQSIYFSTHTASEYKTFVNSSTYSLLVNGIVYAVLILTLFLLLIFAFKDIKEYGKSFKGKAVLWGLLGLVILYAASFVWSYIAYMIQIIIVSNTGLNFNITVNANQSTINMILQDYPVLSFAVFGLIGPVCEELTYRAGLFSLLKRKNRVFAYILTAIIFGAIHFDFTCFVKADSVSYNDYLVNMINELLNLPSYMIGGIVFSAVYDRHGVGASTFAHVFYNCVALIINIVEMKYAA